MDLLTPREHEIVTLFGEGLTALEIALRLHVSARTIEDHLYHARKKFGVHNTRRLIYLARALAGKE